MPTLFLHQKQGQMQKYQLATKHSSYPYQFPLNQINFINLQLVITLTKYINFLKRRCEK